MDTDLYASASKELARKRARARAGNLSRLQAFSARVFADGALPAKTKQLIASRWGISPNVRTAFAATPSLR
jgi:hypothetical protein